MSNTSMPTDFNDLHRLEGLTAVSVMVEGAIPVLSVLSVPRIETSELREWPTPVPLPDNLPPVKALEAAMIPVPFQDWILDVADRMQAPPDYTAAAAVVAAGSAIGRACGIYPKRYDDWLEYPNLWGMVVGRPSLMKSPCIAQAISPLDRLVSDANRNFKQQLEYFEHQKAIAKVAKEVYFERLKKAVRAGNDTDPLIAEMPFAAPPVHRRFTTQDGTTEKIGEILVDNPRGILISRDELSGWWRSLDKTGREGDRSFFLESWNGKGSYTVDRIGRGTVEIAALCLSIFGALTPGPLSEYIYSANRAGIGDDGLIQRFQIAVYPDAPGTWVDVDRFPDTAAKKRVFEIFNRLAENDLYPTAEGGNPPALHFADDAQVLFTEWRYELETRLRGGKLPPSLESHLAKYRKMVPALALIFHLIETADGTASGPVSARAMIQAAAWAEYLETHAVRIYGTAAAPEMEAARQLMHRIDTGDIQDGASLREIHRNQWHRLDNAEAVRGGLSVLVDYGWLRIDKTKTGGRPTETIQLHESLKR